MSVSKHQQCDSDVQEVPQPSEKEQYQRLISGFNALCVAVSSLFVSFGQACNRDEYTIGRLRSRDTSPAAGFNGGKRGYNYHSRNQRPLFGSYAHRHHVGHDGISHHSVA